jgi:hypothetical protein
MKWKMCEQRSFTSVCQHRLWRKDFLNIFIIFSNELTLWNGKQVKHLDFKLIIIFWKMRSQSVQSTYQYFQYLFSSFCTRQSMQNFGRVFFSRNCVTCWLCENLKKHFEHSNSCTWKNLNKPWVMFCSSRSQSWRKIQRRRQLSQFQPESTWDRIAMDTKTRHCEGGGELYTQPRRCTRRLGRPHRSRCTLSKARKTFSNSRKIKFFFSQGQKIQTRLFQSSDTINSKAKIKDEWRRYRHSSDSDSLFLGGKRREGMTLLSPFAETSKEYVLIDLICVLNLIKICKCFKKILPISFILNKNDKNKIQNIQTIVSPTRTS